jgi:hypothetical protein
MKHDDDTPIPLESLRAEYNAPPETPRSEIWKAIEGTLEKAPAKGLLSAMRDAYNPPPPAPREEMWSVIGQRLGVISLEGARRERSVRTAMSKRRWSALAVAAAALLVMGIGLGRWSIAPVDVPIAATELDREPGAGAESFRFAAMSHLSRTEALLTMIGSDARVGRVDTEVGDWGRALLLQTRLLIDSPASGDPLMLALLEDLEIILIQVARLSSGRFDDATATGELDLITEGLTDNNMMLRIRSVLPDGSIQAGI